MYSQKIIAQDMDLTVARYLEPVKVYNGDGFQAIYRPVIGVGIPHILRVVFKSDLHSVIHQLRTLKIDGRNAHWSRAAFYGGPGVITTDQLSCDTQIYAVNYCNLWIGFIEKANDSTYKFPWRVTDWPIGEPYSWFSCLHSASAEMAYQWDLKNRAAFVKPGWYCGKETGGSTVICLDRHTKNACKCTVISE